MPEVAFDTADDNAVPVPTSIAGTVERLRSETTGTKLPPLRTNRTRERITFVSNRLVEAVEQAEAALIRAEAEIYQRGADLVRIGFGEIPGADGQRIRIAQVYEIAEAFLQTEITRYIDWQKNAASGLTRIGPPPAVTKALLKRAGISNFRRLAGVIMCPTLRPDGSVLSYLGYDEKTGLLLIEPPPVPDIPEAPTKDEAKAALADLETLLTEFPFVDDASRSVALSALITPVVRGALVCVPLHAVTAPEAGTGKTHLLDTAASIALGQACPPFAAGRDPDEFDKRLYAELRSGTPLFAIDNVTIELGGDALCQAIERPVINVRILGRTERIQLPNTFTIFANGNNLSFVDDVNRRVLRCGLDAQMEEPRKRQFRSDPVRAVRANRGRFIAAALTVVRAYVVAGMPDRPPGIGEPFSRWSDMVRGALMWLGCADPVLTMDIAHEQDPTFRERLQVFQAMFEQVGDKWNKTGDLISTANGHLGGIFDALKPICERRGELNAVALGKWFGANKGKVAGGMVLECEEDRHTKAWLWRVRRV